MDRSKTAWLAVGALLLPWALLVRAYWFLCDDAFITWRYSRNWALGHGPRYNLGDEVPVEGYSDFLWMAAGALVHRLGGDVTVVIPWLSVGCGAILLALVHRTLLVHLEVPPLLAYLAALGLALSPPFAVWATSGLETMPQALFMFATWLALGVVREDRRLPWVAGLTGLLLALVRTEGVAWALVLGGVALTQRALEGRPVRGPLLRFLAPLLLGYAAYFAWRYGYYQSLFANTAYAKVHLTRASALRGASYVALFVATLITPALLLVSVPLSLRASRPAVAAGAGVTTLGVLAYAVLVSGDYMTWFRLLVPALPFLAVSLGAALAVVQRVPAGRSFAALAALAVAIVGALPAAGVHLVPREARAALNVREKLSSFRDENEQWASMVRHTREWREKGEALGRYARPGDTFVAAAIGNVGYWSDVHLFDRNGLVTREVAMLPWDGTLRSPGHDKTVGYEFFLDRRPTILDAKLVSAPRLKAKVRAALREMDAHKLKDRYFPDVFEVEREGRGRGKVLVALRLATSAEEASSGWERFREHELAWGTP